VLKRKWFDWSFSSVARWGSVFLALFRFLMRRRRNLVAASGALLAAHRSLLGARPERLATKLREVLEALIKKRLSRGAFGHFGLPPESPIPEHEIVAPLIASSLTLKAPRFEGEWLIEKGVLLLHHGKVFLAFRRCVDVAAVVRHYTLVLEPGWSAYANFNLLSFTRYPEHPVLIMATEPRDYRFIKNLETNLLPLDMGSNNWVNPSIFHPLPDVEKIYDGIMVARWAQFKRHHVLFRALQQLRDPSFRVALVGLPPLPEREEAEALLDAYRVRDNITIYERVPQERVNVLLNQSKLNLLLSLQEGSNRCLFEGFLADVPGLALKRNIGVPKDAFTPQTGRLIEEKELPSALQYFREHWRDSHPRAWALAHIGPEIATAKLNTALREAASRRGEEWTTDIVAVSNSPEVQYYPHEHLGKDLPSVAEILVQYAQSPVIREIVRRGYAVTADSGKDITSA